MSERKWRQNKALLALIAAAWTVGALALLGTCANRAAVGAAPDVAVSPG
jgi:hypothetical protein